MERALLHLLWITGLAVAAVAVAQDTSCCTIVGLDTKRQLITAIEHDRALRGRADLPVRRAGE